MLRGEEVLLERRVGPTGRAYLRPIGGNVEFGERGADTAHREFREETGLHVKQVQFLGCVEDLGAGPDGKWHEICLLYQADIVEAQAYTSDAIPIREDDNRHFTAYWIPLAALSSNTERRRLAAAWYLTDLPEIRPSHLHQWIPGNPAQPSKRSQNGAS